MFIFRCIFVFILSFQNKHLYKIKGIFFFNYIFPSHIPRHMQKIGVSLECPCQTQTHRGFGGVCTLEVFALRSPVYKKYFLLQ